MLLNSVYNINTTPPPSSNPIEYFLAKNSSLQTLTTSSNNEVVLGTEVYDTASVFSSNHFTVPSGMNGYYAILVGSVVLDPAQSQSSFMGIEVSTDGGSTWDEVAALGVYPGIRAQAATMVLLATGDKYRLKMEIGASAQDVSFSDTTQFGGIILEPIA